MRFAGVLVAALALGSAAPAAVPVAKPLLPGSPAELKTVDGWALKAVFAPGTPGKTTFILLHGTGQRKEDWKRLAFPLNRAGYGVMAVDLRGHGESRTTPAGEAITWKKLRATTRADNDYVDMSRDAEAAVAWLAGQGVPEDSIGLIGAEVGGSVALRYAATHPKVPLVVMLSPGMKWQEVLTVNALRAMKRPIPTPILMVYSAADRTSSKEAPIMYSFAKGAVGDSYATLIEVPQERGTRMFQARRALIGEVIDWLGDPIRSEPEPLESLSTGTPSIQPADDDDSVE
ncbi:MAG: alpha/beta fold hydrolase [Elusimicrobia bacterium]|nr:alpha/beta fold hydrolase [Elusimicrobiota bacterium]